MSGPVASPGLIIVGTTPDPAKPVVVVDELTSGIALSHQAVAMVEVLEDGAVTRNIEEVTGGSVSLDSNAETRSILDLTIVDDGTLGLVPDSPTATLAPYGNELRVSRGVELADRIELVRLGIFRINSADVEDDGSSLSIHIAGQDRSARIVDANFEEPHNVAAGTLFTDAILSVIQEVYSEVEYAFAETSVVTPALLAEEGEDRWVFAQGLATALGGELFFNSEGLLVLRPVPTASGSPAAYLQEGEGGVLLTAGRNWSREEAFNRVIATGESTAGDGAVPRGIATDDNPLSPTYYYGPFGKAPRFYTSPYITTDDQASDVANGILARELGTTQQVSFGTIVDPARKAGDVVRVTRERTGIDENHVVDTLTIPLEINEAMTGGTRAMQVN